MGYGLRVPSLGLSADYHLFPTPYTTAPDPREKTLASYAFSKAGVDTGQIVVRGGTHYEWSYLPMPTFGATLRGIDLSAWYTTAWFDRYVKGDLTAQRRLLTLINAPTIHSPRLRSCSRPMLRSITTVPSLSITRKTVSCRCGSGRWSAPR